MKKGFTVIELMIIVAVISILGVVAMPKWKQMVEKYDNHQSVARENKYK